MAAYTKINSFTWVLNDGKNKLQEKEALNKIETKIKSENFLKAKKRRKPGEQNEIYLKFCKEVFREKTFICVKEFNSLIVMKFNGNSTFYRNRMIDQGLIIEYKNLIKPNYDNSNREN